MKKSLLFIIFIYISFICLLVSVIKLNYYGLVVSTALLVVFSFSYYDCIKIEKAKTKNKVVNNVVKTQQYQKTEVYSNSIDNYNFYGMLNFRLLTNTEYVFFIN